MAKNMQKRAADERVKIETTLEYALENTVERDSVFGPTWVGDGFDDADLVVQNKATGNYIWFLRETGGGLCANVYDKNFNRIESDEDKFVSIVGYGSMKAAVKAAIKKEDFSNWVIVKKGDFRPYAEEAASELTKKLYEKHKEKIDAFLKGSVNLAESFELCRAFETYLDRYGMELESVDFETLVENTLNLSKNEPDKWKYREKEIGWLKQITKAVEQEKEHAAGANERENGTMIKDLLENVFVEDKASVSDFLEMDKTDFLDAHPSCGEKKYGEACKAFELGVRSVAEACAAGYFNGEGEVPPKFEGVFSAGERRIRLDFNGVPEKNAEGFEKALAKAFSVEGFKASLDPLRREHESHLKTIDAGIESRAEKIFEGMQADGPENTVKTFQEMKEWVETEGLHDRGVLFETVSRMIDGLADFGQLSPEIYDEEIEYENGAEERMDLADAAAALVLDGKLGSWKEIQEWVNEKAKARWSEITGEEVGLDETRDFESPDGTVHDWYGRYVNFRGDERLIMEAGYGEVLGKYLDGGPGPDATSKTMERFAALKRAAREKDEEVFCYLPAGVLRMSDDKVADWMVRHSIDLPYDIPDRGAPKRPLQDRARWHFSEEEFYKFKKGLKEGKAASGFIGSVYFGSMCAEFVCEEPEEGIDFNFFVLGEEGEGEKFGVPYSYHSGERLDPLIVLDNGYEAFKRLAEKEVLAAAEKRPSVSWAAQTPNVDWSDESSVNEFFESSYGFTDDEEKMRDFREISKEEFLSSYDYLSESEYEATERAVEREWKQEVQEFLEKEWSKPEHKGEDVPQVEAVKVWHPQEYGKSKNECLNLLVQLKPGLGGSYSEEDIRQIIAGSALGWAGAVQETAFQPVLPEESGTFDKYLEGLKEAERENKRELAEGYANEVIEAAAKKAAEKFPLVAKEGSGIEGKFETLPNTAKIVEKNIESDNGEIRSILEVSVKVEKDSWLAEKLGEKLNENIISRLQIVLDPEGEVHSVYLPDSNGDDEIYASDKISKVEREMVAFSAKKVIGEYLERQAENGERAMSVKEAFFAFPAPDKVYKESGFEDDLTLSSALNGRFGNPGGEKVTREEAKAMLHYLNAHDYSLYATDRNGKAEFYVLDVSEDFHGEGMKVKSIQDLLEHCADCLNACEEYEINLDVYRTKTLEEAFVKFGVESVMKIRGLANPAEVRPTDLAEAIAEETLGEREKEYAGSEFKRAWAEEKRLAAEMKRKFDPFQATKEVVGLWKAQGLAGQSKIDALNEWLKEKGCVSKEGFERLFKEIETEERKAEKKPRKRTKGGPERGV